MKLGLCALVFAGVSLVSCSSPYARAYAGYTNMGLSGDIALAPTVGGGSLGALKVDVEEELGLEGGSGSPYGRLDAGVGPLGVTLSAFTYSKTGTGTITRQFGNITAGTDVRSDLDLTDIKAALLWNMIDVGPVRLSPGVGVNYVDMTLDVRTVSGIAASDTVDVRAPIPMVFLQGDVELGHFGITVEGGGMKVNLEDADGTYWDLEGLFRYQPVKHVNLFAGYRWISLDAQGTADDQDFDATLQLRGWFVGGGISF